MLLLLGTTLLLLPVILNPQSLNLVRPVAPGCMSLFRRRISTTAAAGRCQQCQSGAPYKNSRLTINIQRAPESVRPTASASSVGEADTLARATTLPTSVSNSKVSATTPVDSAVDRKRQVLNLHLYPHRPHRAYAFEARNRRSPIFLFIPAGAVSATTMTHVTIMFLAATLMLLGRSDAFLPVASAPRCLSRGSVMLMSTSSPEGIEGADEGGSRLTRAQAIRRAAAGSGVLAVGVAVFGGSVQQAVAEEEMKDEVQQFAELRGRVEREGRAEVSRENLSSLTEATNGLKTLNSFIGEKDYQSLRLALRNPPISNLRSSARKVIIGIDNKDAEEKATKAYKALITSVDKLDSIANRGMKDKGGLKDDKEILEVYDNCIERGSDLLTLLPNVL